MFPIPNSLKIAKIVIQVEIIKPRFELAKIKEEIKKVSVNKFAKKRKINSGYLGSAK